MTAFEALTTEQRLRASVHRDVQAICTEACHFLGLAITRPAMDLLLEIFFSKIAIYAEEVEKFARHGRRFMVTGDDIRLLVRKNHTLRTHLDTVVPPPSSPASKEPSKRRRTVAAAPSLPAKRARVDPEEVRDVAKDENNDKAIDLTFD